MSLNSEHKEHASEAGFSNNLEIGETVLPAFLGTITEFNSKGKYIPQKDQEMETVYRQKEWTWKEFRGRNNFEEKTGVVETPYKRYPREFTTPPSVELTVALDSDNKKVICSPELTFSSTQSNDIIHTINLFFEIFGECEIRNRSLNPTVTSNIQKLNWDILPQGKKPWDQLEPLLRKVSKGVKPGNKFVIDSRFEKINTFEPEFTAVGNAGFSGYVVFGFPDKNLYILESNVTNNATYVFDKDWETLSQLTKAEVLNQDLQIARVIHRKNWFDQIDTLLKD